MSPFIARSAYYYFYFGFPQSGGRSGWRAQR
jgi:hypothetical protein